EKSAAQEVLASTMLAPATQVAFNLKKGSMPVRGDIDLSTANDCMKKGLEILKAGNIIQSTDELISPDTTTQLNDLVTQFFADESITPEKLQADFAEVISKAD
ncbi:MAG: carbohydrate ABC transporter substrate-binding protein, partial [Paracoccaceae bacterium]